MSSLPGTSDPETTLFVFLHSESEWKSVCRRPLSELRKLSKRPAKWFSYIAWCVYGTPGRLHMSKEPTSLEISANTGAPLEIDPTAPVLPAEYEPRYIDLHMLADRTSVRREWRPRQKQFWQRLRQRDRRCIFAQASPIEIAREIRPNDCEAVHILPHAKGREYLEHSEAKHKVPEHAQLHGIDDPRNVPNPYMDVEDVYTGSANAEFPHGVPDGDTYEEQATDYENQMDEDDEDDYSGHEYDIEEREVAEAADVELSAPEPQDYPGTLDLGMTDDSRLLLQWVGLHYDQMAASYVPNNTHATLRLGTRLATLGLHHAYACAIINRWGRDLPDAPPQPEKASSQRRKDQKAKRERQSPPFSTLSYSLLDPSIQDGYTQHARGKVRSHTRTIAPKPSPMDWAWDVILQFSLPPPEVAAEQEAAAQARTRAVEEASAAKVAEWLRDAV
ncbi:hypothetical protein DFH09DRAFT_1379001 [Mycena vulgaris]|nr:hypothetical protein DFH09DRAFT_1379001 [Mycena vulgaris]